MFHSLLVQKWIITETAHIWFFKIVLYIYIKYKSEIKYDWKKCISCAITVFVTKNEKYKKENAKSNFQWQFLILYLWWLRSTFFLVTMRSYRRSILLKSVKGSHLHAFIKKTTWNLKATNQFSTNGKLKPMSLYCRTYDVNIKLSSMQNCW